MTIQKKESNKNINKDTKNNALKDLNMLLSEYSGEGGEKKDEEFEEDGEYDDEEEENEKSNDK